MPFDNEPRPLEVRIEEHGSVTVVALSGELDLTSAPRVEAAFEQVADGPATALIVDVQGLSFMDSTGIRTLLNAKRRADADGHSLAILNGSGPAHRILGLSGVDGHIQMLDDLSDRPEIAPPTPRAKRSGSG